MKPLYYQNRRNGMIYRNNRDGTESVLDNESGQWRAPRGICLCKNTTKYFRANMRRISAKVVSPLINVGYDFTKYYL